MGNAWNAASSVLASSLAGAELLVAAVVHPSLGALPEARRRPARAALARRLGALMPAWYAASAATALGAAVVGDAGAARRRSGAAAGLLAAAIVATIVLLVPRNARIASAPRPQDPASWERDAREWDRLHAVRVGALSAAAALLAARRA